MPDELRLKLTLTPREDIPFLFPSYRQLIRSLGAVDGLGAGLTLASRCFVDASQQAPDPQEFARAEARKYQVRTAFVEFSRLTPHLNQLLIVGTSQQAEEFFRAFRREQSVLGRRWRNKRDDEAPITYILDCLPGGFRLNVRRVWYERYLLHEYYRKIRNGFVHTSSRSKLADAFSEVCQLRQRVKDDYSLMAPNTFDQLDFNDHLLYTRLTKYIATDLCRLASPSNAIEIKFVLVHMTTKATLASLIRHRSEPETLRKVLRSWLKEAYNFKLSARADIEEELIEWFDQIPTKKERKKREGISAVDCLRSAVPQRLIEREEFE